MPVLVPNRYRGKLIIVEGIDGSGKSTQLSLLSQWLRSQRIGCLQRMELVAAGA
jgi:thymidylate kinase